MKRLAPGTRFAQRFTITKLLGSGAMGSVYQAEDSAGHTCALKLLHADLFDADPRAVHRFEREARLGAELQCPFIVRVHATGLDDETTTPWLAMELLAGSNLAQRVASDGPPTLEVARVWLHELFAAMRSAHAAGVVHRDLKPENVFLLEPGLEGQQLKVLDFGIAKHAGGEHISYTAAGLGTPLWTAPEQGRDDWVPAPSADVWALGLLSFFLITGKVYWRNANRGSMASLAMELIRGTIERPSARATELGCERSPPGAFDAWFLRAVSRDASLRFADADAAFAALPDDLRA